MLTDTGESDINKEISSCIYQTNKLPPNALQWMFFFLEST